MGKTTMSSLLADAAQLRHINVGDVVKEKNFYDGWDENLECHFINENQVMERENLDEFLKLTKTIDWITGDETAPINNKVVVKIKREMILQTIGIGTVCSGYCLVALSLQVRYSLTETESVGEEVALKKWNRSTLKRQTYAKKIILNIFVLPMMQIWPLSIIQLHLMMQRRSLMRNPFICDHTSELDQAESEAHDQQLIDRVQLYESKLNSSMTCVDELVYIMGGYDGSTWLPSLESYSPSKETVRSHMPMSCIRAYASATVFYGHIYIFGGGNGVDLDVWYDSAAVVQLKAFNGAVVSDDKNLSDLNVEKTKLLQKILVYVALVICSFVDLNPNMYERAQVYSNTVEFSLPSGDTYTTNLSSSEKDHVSITGLHWHQKAIVSVTEASGLTWLRAAGGRANSGVVKKTRTHDRAVRAISVPKANAELQVNLNVSQKDDSHLIFFFLIVLLELGCACFLIFKVMNAKWDM
ncbi:hypothetical protein GIB67_015298 [Kingdonia uniflora]|uniref:Uncharacterized protein n=1 Tax=Kingdonia uniflora TaxID=39325 RepID=A0A7J7LM87_9MAGN|nr:hypothetical protein GIB67_015298 [Kingdonia uniflora]